MTPLDIAAYTVLEDLVLDSLSGSFPAAAHVSGQLYVGCSAYRLLGRRAMTPAIGVNLREHLAYSTLERGRQQEPRVPNSALPVPEAGGEITLEHIT